MLMQTVSYNHAVMTAIPAVPTKLATPPARGGWRL
jgi:hypothetical protein